MPKKIKKLYPYYESPLYRLKSIHKLAEILGLSFNKLQKIVENAEDCFVEWDKSEKNKKLRRIEHPKFPLKKLHTRIANLLKRISPPDYLYCPVKGRSYVDNAFQHKDADKISCLDIKKFYPSTTAKRMFWFFSKRMECSRDVAGTLTRLVTFKEHLPTGSPASPLLAFYSYIDMWEEINAIAEREESILTVYVDDLSLSGKMLNKSVIWEIKQVIFKYGLRYHKEKFFPHGQGEITGIFCGDQKVRAPKRQHKKIRETRDKLQTDISHEERIKLRKRLKSLISQIEQIEKLNSP